MSAPITDAALPQPGDILAGKYRVEAVLGAGGMGIVVSARHLELGQRVALKLLRSAFAAQPDAIARFQREARALAGIRSEHVVRVHDVARLESGAPYLVMEHLTGQDLDQLLRARGPLPIAEVADYVLQACEAIAEAHAAGIIHRDLKPANLFLTTRADGSSLVKVLDFGISKLTGVNEAGVPEGSLTQTSDILGSPWYMSPEQLRSFKNVDARADVWALGVILHRLLSARQPFDADSLSACITRIVADPPIALRAARADAPPELESLILRCLEKDVSRRIQNVGELALLLLPFAPPRSILSVERIRGVLSLANPVEEMTVPLPPIPLMSTDLVAPAPPAASPRERLMRGNTSAAVARSILESEPPRARGNRSLLIAAALVIVGAAAAGLAALRALPTRSAPAFSAQAAQPELALPSSFGSVAPPTEATTADAPASAPAMAAPIASGPPPLVARPRASSTPSAAPAAPVKPPARRVTGPLETTL